MIYRSIVELTGNTPLVQLKNHEPSAQSDIYLKLEWTNAGGSIKDCIALSMIEDVEAQGRLKPGMTIVESSSGNTAIGLAILSAIRGYRFIAVCDRFLPPGKKYKLWAYGASIAFLSETPEGEDTVEMRIEVARRIADQVPGAITLNQYDNRANQECHFRTTGRELLRDMNERLDACVVSMGTCGSISGIGAALKAISGDVLVVGVEPFGSVIYGGEPGPYLVSGGGLSFVPGNLNRSVVDRAVKIADLDAFRAARDLARTEGIMVGGTGGLVVRTCRDLAVELGPGKRIVGILPDSGDRYLESIYSDAWMREHGLPLAMHRDQTEPPLLAAIEKEGCTLDEY
jgi:cysteine synthase